MLYSVLYVDELNAKTIVLNINLIFVKFKPVKSSVLSTSLKCYAPLPAVKRYVFNMLVYFLNLHTPPMTCIKYMYLPHTSYNFFSRLSRLRSRLFDLNKNDFILKSYYVIIPENNEINFLYTNSVGPIVFIFKDKSITINLHIIWKCVHTIFVRNQVNQLSLH